VVDAVWGELVSDDFPVKQGKNREISIIRGQKGDLEAGNTAEPLAF